MNFLLDSHCHTISSGHAYSTIKECFDYSSSIGLKLLAITDHAPALEGGACSLYFMNITSLPKKISGVEFMSGVELNILDEGGNVDLENGLLKKLDVIIASLHTPVFKPADKAVVTNAVLNVMDNPHLNILGHLGDPRYPLDIERVVRKAKEKRIIIEVNNKSCTPDFKARYSEENQLELIRQCARAGVFVVASSDSHFHEHIGNMENAKKMLEKARIPESLILNTNIDTYRLALKKDDSIWNGGRA